MLMSNEYLKPILIMLAVIAACAILSRIISGGETLSDYARKNPDTAYGSSEVADSSDESTSDSGEEISDLDLEKTEASSDSSSLAEDSVSESSDSSIEAASFKEDRVLYDVGFYYDPLDDSTMNLLGELSGGNALKEMTAGDYSTTEYFPVTSLYDLRLCTIRYIDFNGNTQSGELVCNKLVADDIIQIFYELYKNQYQIASVGIIGGSEYASDDPEATNMTYCFNPCPSSDYPDDAAHALGMAIDINPMYNPTVSYDSDNNLVVVPASGEEFADRSTAFAYKIDSDDLAYKLFTEHGFIWGGNRNNNKAYGHFEKK